MHGQTGPRLWQEDAAWIQSLAGYVWQLAVRFNLRLQGVGFVCLQRFGLGGNPTGVEP